MNRFVFNNKMIPIRRIWKPCPTCSETTRSYPKPYTNNIYIDDWPQMSNPVIRWDEIYNGNNFRRFTTIGVNGKVYCHECNNTKEIFIGITDKIFKVMDEQYSFCPDCSHTSRTYRRTQKCPICTKLKPAYTKFIKKSK